MASFNITDDGDTFVQINRGHAFSAAVSGTLDGTVTAQYATGEPVAASLTTSLTGANNDVTFTAKNAGIAGNSLTVAYVDPSENSAELSFTFDGTDLVISLATDSEGAITTTGQDIVDLVSANPSIYGHIGAANASSNTGAGVVTALSETALSGGTNGTFASFASGDGGEFSAAGERVFVNCGLSNLIKFVTADTTTTDADLIVTDLGKY